MPNNNSARARRQFEVGDSVHYWHSDSYCYAENIEGIVTYVQRGPTPKSTYVRIRVTKSCDTRDVGTENLIRSDRVFKNKEKQ